LCRRITGTGPLFRPGISPVPGCTFRGTSQYCRKTIRSMKMIRLFTLALLIGACVRPAKEPEKTSAQILFNGRDLTGWHVRTAPADSAKAYWYVEDSYIVARSEGDSLHDYIWLLSDREYADFELRLKFQPHVNCRGNTGLQIRSRYDDKNYWLHGPQIDIHPPDPWRTGFMWDETKGNQRWIYPDLPDTSWVDRSMRTEEFDFYYFPADTAWNELVVEAKGTSVRAWLNGVQVTDLQGEGILNDSLHQSLQVGMNGHIALQIHSGDQVHVRFKDLSLIEL
jgi:hypothetical protein